MGIASGPVFAAVHQGSGRIAAWFSGEGTPGQGLLYTVINLAKLWSLPVLYVCENHLYSEFITYAESRSGEIVTRPQEFGKWARVVDWQDVWAVRETSDALVSDGARWAMFLDTLATPIEELLVPLA